MDRGIREPQGSRTLANDLPAPSLPAVLQMKNGRGRRSHSRALSIAAIVLNQFCRVKRSASVVTAPTASTRSVRGATATAAAISTTAAVRSRSAARRTAGPTGRSAARGCAGCARTRGRCSSRPAHSKAWPSGAALPRQRHAADIGHHGAIHKSRSRVVVDGPRAQRMQRHDRVPGNGHHA
jgi:hypothetical protein